MAQVVLDRVTKVYPGGVKAVDEIELTVADQEFIVLVGPSGCGKSTTLRMIAGLEEITAGRIYIGDRLVNGVAPKDRDIAMVFQNYALYPHMNVYKNMAFGLMMRRRYAGWDNPLVAVILPRRYRRARQERQQIDARVNSAAAMLGIRDLLRRRPRELSGGQRQRVAVGRAIVRQPKAFLFDEPLSNLDAKLRIEMRGELKALHRRVQTTTVYVTHDQEEAMTLGDRVVVMKDGRLQQCACPFEVYERPANRFVAGFVGTPPMNFLQGRLRRDGERLVFDDGRQRLTLCPEHARRLGGLAGRPIVMGVRPEALRPGAGAQPGTTLRVRVEVVEPLGERMDVLVAAPGQPRIVCRMPAREAVRENEPLDMQVDMNRVHFFEPDGAGRNLSLPGQAAAG